MPGFLYNLAAIRINVWCPVRTRVFDMPPGLSGENRVPQIPSGTQVRPRDFFLKMIEPRLLPLPGEEDVCVMWNTAWGRETLADCNMWAGADRKNGISAMARLTASCAAVAARLLEGGEIDEKGIVAPEDAIKGEVYVSLMQELEKRGISVVERTGGIES